MLFTPDQASVMDGFLAAVDVSLGPATDPVRGFMRFVGHTAAATAMSCRTATVSRDSARRFRVTGTSRITAAGARGHQSPRNSR